MMGRSIIITLLLIASVPVEAVRSECSAAGTIYRTGCPGELLVDCLYDESQCDILNINQSIYTINKWEQKQITWAAGDFHDVDLSGTGQCAKAHACDGVYSTIVEYPRFFPPVVTTGTWSQTAQNRGLDCFGTLCPLLSHETARRTCNSIDAEGSDIAVSNGSCSGGGGGGGWEGCQPCSRDFDCEFCGDAWCNYSLDECEGYTPILIDINGDGYRMTNAAGGVGFDFKGDGTRKTLSWTSSSSDDAWLALDRNGNGTIDGGPELFGSSTPQTNVGVGRNGFIALAEYDKPSNGGNADGSIDRGDAIFASLILWQDLNHNGTSEPTELHALHTLGLASIDLDYKESKRVDRYGNRFKYRSKVRDSTGAQLGRWAWDVFLRVQR
jgi:hypothetical protein